MASGIKVNVMLGGNLAVRVQELPIGIFGFLHLGNLSAKSTELV